MPICNVLGLLLLSGFCFGFIRIFFAFRFIASEILIFMRINRMTENGAKNAKWRKKNEGREKL